MSFGWAWEAFFGGWFVVVYVCFVYVHGWWGVGILVFLEGSCEFGYFVF